MPAYTLLVATLFVLGTALRFYQLSTEGFWVDEIIMGRLTMQPTDGLLRKLLESGRAPLYPLLGHLWMKAFGESQAAARSISAVFGALSIPLLYAVGVKLFGRRVGLIVALLMTLSPFAIFYSQDFRYYSLVILVTLGMVWMLTHALDTCRTRHFALFAVLAIVLFYTHPLAAALVITALGFFFLVQWKAYRPVLIPRLLSQALIMLGARPTLALRIVRSLERSADPRFAGALLVRRPNPHSVRVHADGAADVPGPLPERGSASTLPAAGCSNRSAAPQRPYYDVHGGGCCLAGARVAAVLRGGRQGSVG